MSSLEGRAHIRRARGSGQGRPAHRERPEARGTSQSGRLRASLGYKVNNGRELEVGSLTGKDALVYARRSSSADDLRQAAACDPARP
jgi:hypothetical protein